MAKKQLTAHELNIVLMFADGMSRKEICQELETTPASLSGYIRLIRSKLHARTITHAVALCYQEGLILIKDDNADS